MKKTLSKIFILGAIFFLGVNTTFAENNASDVFYSSFGGSLKMNSDTFALTGKTDGSASNDEFRATFYLQESVNKNSKKELG
jgi:hypothetical protein